MWSLKRCWIWLCRMGHCRGFGVQSPWAYQLVRYVINEHWPYYCYADLSSSTMSNDWLSQHLGRLYFRLSNYMQAQQMVDYCPETDDWQHYLHNGNLKANVLRVDTADALRALPRVELLRMSLTGDYKTAFWASLQKVEASSLIILQDIWRDATTKAFWREVQADARCTTTFDLYYCGLVFFDAKRYKKNYIINF